MQEHKTLHGYTQFRLSTELERCGECLELTIFESATLKCMCSYLRLPTTAITLTSEQVAKKIGCSPRQVKRAFISLHEKNLITVPSNPQEKRAGIKYINVPFLIVKIARYKECPSKYYSIYLGRGPEPVVIEIDWEQDYEVYIPEPMVGDCVETNDDLINW